MADQIFDLYGDLEEFELKQVVKEKNDAHKKLEEKYDLAIQTIKKLQNDVKTWKKKCNNIEKSFWSLLETSKAEIKRKDSQLDGLRKQRDDIAFRRVKHNTSNVENHSSIGHGNTPSTNPFRCPNKEIVNDNIHIKAPISQQMENLRKKKDEKYYKRENISHCTSENKESRSHYNDSEYHSKNKDYISEKNYSRDSSSSSNSHSRHNSNNKEENYSKKSDRDSKDSYHNTDKKYQKNENIERKNSKDSGKYVNTQNCDKKLPKDDNRSKKSKENTSKICEVDKREKHEQLRNKDRRSLPGTSKCKSDTERNYELSQNITLNDIDESTKLTIPNSKEKNISKIPISIVDSTTDTCSKKLIANPIRTAQKNYTESPVNNLITELMKDLKKLNNNVISPVKKKNTKSFEDVLFDNMVCGDESLSVVEVNAESNRIEITNKNSSTVVQVEDEDIYKNLEISSKESIRLIPKEIPLENSFTSDLKLDVDDTPMINAGDKRKSIDVHDCEIDLFDESLNENIETINKLDSKDEKIETHSYNKSLKLFGTNTATPINSDPEHISTTVTELHIENNLNGQNKSATKFYELYLESPVKEICNINAKNTEIVTEDIQNIHAEEKKTENEEHEKRKHSHRRLINNCSNFDKKSNIKEMLEKKDEIFNEIGSSTNNAEISSESRDTIMLNKEPNVQVQNNEEIKELSNTVPENNESEICTKLDKDSEVAIVENDNSKPLNINCNSETAVRISPNQQETLEATRYLTEILRKNTLSENSPSKSPLKMRMKLLFGDTPDVCYKIISNPSTTDNKDETLKSFNTNNEILNVNNSKEIVEDNNMKLKSNIINEDPKETEIASDKIGEEFEINTKERKNKRKAEICLDVSNTKKLKIDSRDVEKDLQLSKPDTKKYEIQAANDKNSGFLTEKISQNSNTDNSMNSNEEPELNYSTPSKPQSEIVSKKLEESHPVEDEKMSCNKNIDSYFLDEEPSQQYNNENVEKISQLELSTNKENIVGTAINNDISEPVIVTLNITRKKRKSTNQNAKSSKNKYSSPEQNEYSNSNQNNDQQSPKIPQNFTKSIEERKECIKNYKIPKLNKISRENKTLVSHPEMLMKNFKIPKIKKNCKLSENNLDEINKITDSTRMENEYSKEEKKLLYSKSSSNLPVSDCNSTSKIANTGKLTEKCEKENTNLSMPVVLSKNDEELFDCIFKSPLQISGANNSPHLSFELENSGNSDHLKFNQIEEDFRNIFGKSPQSTTDLLSSTISTKIENNCIQNNNKSPIENSSNSRVNLSVMLDTGGDKDESENNRTIKNSSSINESSIVCKNFSTSAKEYQMVYDTNEGITNWVITRKKIKKKKKSIT